MIAGLFQEICEELREAFYSARHGGHFHRHVCRCGARWWCGLDDCEQGASCEECEREWQASIAQYNAWLELPRLHRATTPIGRMR